MIEINTEHFDSDLFEEILPLSQKCWEESTAAKGATCAFYGERDFAIEPDMETYQQLEDNGVLVIVTLRDSGELKGYVVGFSYRALHHKKIIGGIGDSIYIEPDYRSYAAVIAEKFENELRALGVQIIGWPVTPDGPVHEVLKARGYAGDDIVMEKRLRPCA
jgi:hypothetical protein